jgi:manganese/zinc/iron transport system permease protein
MMALAVTLGIGCALIGYYLAVVLDVAIAGMMAVVAGGFFMFALLLSPSHGLLASLLRHRRNRRSFARSLLLAKLAGLGGRATEEELAHSLDWDGGDVSRALRDATHWGLVLRPTTREVAFTDEGRKAADNAVEISA